jgi:tetratricopeptide (TPR) repeat protein
MPVFSDLEYLAALALAVAQDRALLVNITAVGSRACEEMKRFTWNDAHLAEVVAARYVAIEVAAGSGPALKLRPRVFPTIVAIRGGVELDRVEAARSAAFMLRWLEGLERGLRESALLAATSRELKARLGRARALRQSGEFDEALEEYTWLWENALGMSPSWAAVRHSYLVAELREVVANSSAARERFERLRDTAENDLVDPQSLKEWSSLNLILGDSQRVIDWLRNLPPRVATSLHIARSLQVKEAVREHGAWEVFARFIENPVGLLREENAAQSTLHIALKVKSAPERTELFESVAAESFRTLAALLYRSLVSAGREAEAAAVVAEAKHLDPSAEMEAALATESAVASGGAANKGRRSKKAKKWKN